ncbi:MAG: hypothetical protein CMM56_02365 [Rhodospirillaceae bacterium]|nr:hypothetical protein [Rhodospirillaceae bacterium]
MIEHLPLLVEMRSSLWLFPTIATVHLFGLVVVGGAVLLGDLSLMGYGLANQPTHQIAREIERLQITGILIMGLTGLPLFMCFATKYYYLSAFWVKLIALISAITFTFTIRKAALLNANTSQNKKKTIALISLSLWGCISVCGRLIGFP